MDLAECNPRRVALPYAAAAGAVLGSWLLIELPVGLPIGLLVVSGLLCVWWPRAVVVLIAVAALCGLIGSRALDGLAEGPVGPVQGWVTLLDDPRSTGPSGVRVTVRYGDSRLEARAFAAAAARINDALAGERIEITGSARRAGSDWHRWRHVASTVNVTTVGRRAEAAPVAAFANRVRRLLESGASSLDNDRRSMFSGMVYGDDRAQSARLADDFRAAGLGHLLVVSGQNVAFVLALASPLLVRARPGVRLLVLLALLGVFALLTRFEPSVLRAVAMAGAAVTSTALGRPESGRRTLASAVAVVLIIDPFLVRVLAFQLSVCATSGLLWISPALTERLRGPQPLRLAVATTAGAQLAVTPLLVAVFGSVPVASLPANLAAGPASAPVMMWGLTGGVAAGLTGGSLAWLLHLPTAALLWWVRQVAATAAVAPPAMLAAPGALAVGAGVAVVLVAGRLRVPQGARPVAAVLVVAVLAYSVAASASLPQGWSSVEGAQLLRHGSTVVVVLDEPDRPVRLLQALRLAGVRRVDLVVASRGGSADAHAVVALTDRYRAAAVVAPPMHRVPGARTVRAATVLRVGELRLEITADTPQLAVAVNGSALSSAAHGRAARHRRRSGTASRSGRGDRHRGAGRRGPHPRARTAR